METKGLKAGRGGIVAEQSNIAAELNLKQILLQQLLSKKRNEIFHSTKSKGHDYIAVAEEQNETLAWHLFKTKEDMISFLSNKDVFAYDSRNSNQMILMF